MATVLRRCGFRWLCVRHPGVAYLVGIFFAAIPVSYHGLFFENIYRASLEAPTLLFFGVLFMIVLACCFLIS